jgi:fibronectin-binding autotransporter adhesin
MLFSRINFANSGRVRHQECDQHQSHISRTRRGAYLTSTALVSLTFAAALVVSVGPALAAGGDGGGNPASGGADGAIAAGTAGTPGAALGQGGGGGGAGTTGGTGGDGGGAGAGTGNTAGNPGNNATGGTNAGGGGGGGGNHGSMGGTLPVANSTGTAGGAGGKGDGTGNGGGGGGGGYGAVVTGGGPLGNLGFTVTGAVGGAGGIGAVGGNGGTGGIGLDFTNSTAKSFTVNAAITGGAGGAGGPAGGVAGAGGAGIVGQNLAITMGTGTVAGGGGANAITFTGGTNALIFNNAASGLTGGLGVTGSLDLSTTVATTTVANNITGAGSVSKSAVGTIVLSGNNTYTGTTTVNAGVLQAGSTTGFATSSAFTVGTAGTAATLDLNGFNNTISSLAGNANGIVTNSGAADATLTAGGDNTSTTFAGVIKDGATNKANLTKVGTGVLTLSGANTAGSQFTGTANVNAGTLRVGGTFGNTVVPGNTMVVNVNNTGTLDGNGTVAGSVVVNIGGTISAGNPGSTAGTLAITNDLTLNAGSTSIFDLNTAGQRNFTNDLITVGGNLTLGGTLTVTGAQPSGLYRLFEYGGTESGTFAAKPANLTVLTNITGQVNARISNGGQLVQVWDGLDQTGNGAANGGTGTWKNTNTNWTEPVYDINDQWRSQVGVFGGAAGTVTVDNSAGNVAFQGLQFSTTGYLVTGNPLTLTGSINNPIPNTAAFVNVDPGVVATINSNLVGAAGIGLQKLGSGTLILSGDNSGYTGVTTITAGILKAGSIHGLAQNSDFVVGSIVGTPAALDLNGFSNTIGSLAGNANGIVTNTAAAAAALSTNALNNASTTYAGIITDTAVASPLTPASAATANSLTLNKNGTGTLTLSGTSNYHGNTTVNNGVLQAGSATAYSANSHYVVGTGGTSAALDLNGFSNTIGSLSGNANGRVTNTNAATAAALSTNGLNNASTTFSGNITDTATSSSVPFIGPATAGSLALTKNGTGTLTLSGTNNYHGITTVNTGTLQAGSTNAFSANSHFVVGTGLGSATLDLNGFNNTIGSLVGGGTVTNTASLAPGVTLKTNGLNNVSTVFGGVITDTALGSGPLPGAPTAGSLGLTKDGPSTLILSGANTYHGDTTVNNGILVSGAPSGGLSPNSHFIVGTALTVGNATLDLFGNSGTVGSLSGNAKGIVTNTATAPLSGATLTTNLLNNASTTFAGVVTDTSSATDFSGRTAAGRLSLVKNGTGTLTLSGTVSYKGDTTVNAGTLSVANTFTNIQGSTLTVKNTGNYTIASLLTNSGAITVAAGGTLTANTPGINNTATGTIVNNGTINDVLNNAGLVNNNAIYNATVATNTGTINNSAPGVWTGAVQSNTGTITNSGTWTTTAGGFTNSAGGVLNVVGGSTINATVGGFTNAGTMNATDNSILTSTTLANTGTINLNGPAGTTTLNASTAAYSGNGGTVSTQLNLNGTGAINSIRLASAAGSTNYNVNVAGSGATGLFPILAVSGASTNTVASANFTGSLNPLLYQYSVLAPGAGSNATSNTSAFVAPNTGPTAGALTGILSTLSAIDASFHQPGGNLVASPQTDKTGQMVGGPWVRASGGVTTVFSTGTAGFNGTVYDTAQSKTRVQFSGVQAGADTGWLNLGGNGVNAHFGVTGGNISANSTEQLSTTNQVSFEVPFVGVYGLVTKAGFSTDFTYRHSYYNMNVTNPILMLNNAGFKGQSDNVNGSISYNIALPRNFFIEPTANLSYTRSTFDNLPVVGGAAVLGFNEVKSLLGRAGARVGTAFSYGGFNWSPFGIALVQNEFEKNASGTFTAAAGSPFDLVSSRVGTFGQTSLGLAFQSQTNGLLGFVRADYRFGPRLNGAALLGGVRYTFGP